MKRSLARELVFSYLYQRGYEEEKGIDIATHLKSLGKNFSEIKQYEDSEVVQYATVLAQGVLEKEGELISIIEKVLINCKFEQIDRLEQLILLMGTYEINFLSDIPPNVTINEAIILAKRFAQKDSFAFINRILDNIAKGK